MCWGRAGTYLAQRLFRNPFEPRLAETAETLDRKSAGTVLRAAFQLEVQLMKRAAIYARVSTRNGHQDPETQLLALRQVAERAGWQIVERVRRPRHQRRQGPRQAASVRSAAQGRHAAPVRSGDGLVRRPSRPLAPGPRGLPRRPSCAGRRPVSAHSGYRHHDARRQGAVPDDGRVRRVRAGDHSGAGVRRARQGAGEGQAARASQGACPS